MCKENSPTSPVEPCEFCRWDNPRYRLPDGRPAGFLVAAVCAEPRCDATIHRGLFHLCGDYPDSGRGCGQYFCTGHLYVALPSGPQRCGACNTRPVVEPRDSLRPDGRRASTAA